MSVDPLVRSDGHPHDGPTWRGIAFNQVTVRCCGLPAHVWENIEATTVR